MKVHVLVEGLSEKALIDRWAPRAFRGHSFEAHPHQGKGTLPDDPAGPPVPRRRGLLDLLPATLRAFAAAGESAILVLVDADRDDCTRLKRRLVAMAAKLDPRPNVVFRIAVEETEAFYLGDLHALGLAFPKADTRRARQYKPDSICGTAELFGEIVGDGGLNKVWWAEAIGPHLTTVPKRSRSPSFRALHAGVKKLLETSDEPAKKRKFKHVARTSGKRRRPA